MTIYAVWDIGGTGRSADAAAIWIMQLVGPQIRMLDYYEAQGQPLAAHVNWLQDNGYSKAHCVLPHDGVKHDFVYDVTYESALKKAGFEVTVIPNQGRGAALKRVEVARRMFPNIWFDKDKTSGGVEAISAYHERKDEVRGIGLGPEHDWASHGADAFGLACVFASDPPAQGGWGSSLGRQIAPGSCDSTEEENQHGREERGRTASRDQQDRIAFAGPEASAGKAGPKSSLQTKTGSANGASAGQERGQPLR